MNTTKSYRYARIKEILSEENYLLIIVYCSVIHYNCNNKAIRNKLLFTESIKIDMDKIPKKVYELPERYSIDLTLNDFDFIQFLYKTDKKNSSSMVYKMMIAFLF